jgi:hypothetical protein
MTRPTRKGEERRPRGYLEFDVNLLLKDIITGEVQIKPNAKLTPSGVRRLFGDVNGTPKEDLPSAGAIYSIFKRWEQIGYATFVDVPFSFLDFTEEGRKYGLDALREKAKNSDSGVDNAAAGS